jgi:hypothetical protein
MGYDWKRILTVIGTSLFVNPRLPISTGFTGTKKHHQSIKLFPRGYDKIRNHTNTGEELA